MTTFKPRPYHKPSVITHVKQIHTPTGAVQGLSPIASVSSSTSCIPKSSSSTGPISTHSPIDYDLHAHATRGSIQTIADIDDRLEEINE